MEADELRRAASSVVQTDDTRTVEIEGAFVALSGPHPGLLPMSTFPFAAVLLVTGSVGWSIAVFVVAAPVTSCSAGTPTKLGACARHGGPKWLPPLPRRWVDRAGVRTFCFSQRQVSLHLMQGNLSLSRTEQCGRALRPGLRRVRLLA